MKFAKVKVQLNSRNERSKTVMRNYQDYCQILDNSRNKKHGSDSTNSFFRSSNETIKEKIKTNSFKTLFQELKLHRPKNYPYLKHRNVTPYFRPQCKTNQNYHQKMIRNLFNSV